MSSVPQIYRTVDTLPHRIDAATLRVADTAVGGLITVYTGTDYARVRRGVNALIAAWKQGNVTDRLHGCVRAMDALMKLPQGRSRVEFIRRLPVFATAARIADIADALYRLRSYDEHLSEWPTQLADIAAADRPRFVAQQAFYAETVVGFCYRTLLGDPALLGRFRTDADLDAFWSAGQAAWTQRIDLDAEEARRFRYQGP